ncbi:hypothetical protein H5410_026803 [Solanum commersonii]|uniref:Uncharacterized protein n=1 Tax=Solanum commersonii TaxID=4109 RepID=A0A9J5Z042_SOLCO|nr:hypothetical protein H5410_026803 [Solanum commersonii]
MQMLHSICVRSTWQQRCESISKRYIFNVITLVILKLLFETYGNLILTRPKLWREPFFHKF